MENFSIQFTYPWLLLLIIPAIGLALIPYFRVSKKYRRTRNRITSVVLHSIIMVCCILVLSGIQFTYQVPNESNEIILLVDVSQTEEQSQENRDDFVQTVLEMGKYDNFRMGIVTFGFNQVYAVPLTDKIDKVYSAYKDAELPDTSATDIAAALTYTKDLFDNPQSAKIVIVTDGKETDETASTVIKSVAAQGIIVDTAYIPSSYSDSDSQIIGVTMPDYHVNVGDECDIGFTVQSNASNTATVKMYDNGTQVNTEVIDVYAGMQSFTLKHAFDSEGMHEILFEISSSNDSIQENNKYYSYIYLNVFKDVLIVERNESESEQLIALLTADDKYNVTTLNLVTDEIPTTVEELCNYEQIILNDIANSDMPETFVSLLYSYVYDYGGGLFTVGGSDDDGTAHAYNREDMYSTLFQQMLPVEAINYTPPVAVVVIIDRSGSMGEEFGSGGNTRLDFAREGATACLEALTERDYFGLMTLDSDYNTVLPLTECTKDNVIRNAIASVNTPTGGTVYPGAIYRAGQALRALTNVSKRHIIIISDGEVPDSEHDAYMDYINNFYNNDGITVSFVGISVATTSSAIDKMQEIVDAGHGNLYAITKGNELVQSIRNDINAPEIKEVNYETFNPTVYTSVSSILNGITLIGDSDLSGSESDTEVKNKLPFTIDGFYGVKIRSSSTLVLVGDYNVPIYAQWKFGSGMVGSFMCDLSGRWSSNIFETEEGKQFVLNIVNSLMPVEEIKPNEFNVDIKEGNYINQLSIYASLKEGEKIEGTISSIDGSVNLSLNAVTNTDSSNETSASNTGCYVSVCLNSSNNYSRSTFVIAKAGIYLIQLKKVDANGEVLATYQTYKQFSYSIEYNLVSDMTEAEIIESLYNLADKGNGQVYADEALYDPSGIFDNFVTIIDLAFDPAMILLIIAIVLFLLDLIVRKFKFKWIHEMVRDYKAKRNVK